MNESPTPAQFQTGNDRDLRQAGLAGRLVWATLRDGGLDLQGDEGGLLRIAAADVARLRVGFLESKSGRHYQAAIWRRGAGKPLWLHPSAPTWPGYAQTMRGFAAAIAGQAGAGRIEGGSSKFDALLGPVLMAIPAFAVLGLALFILTDAPWYGRLIMPVIPLALFFLLLKRCIDWHWPRAMRDIADLDVQLPLSAKPTRGEAFRHLFVGRRRRR